MQRITYTLINSDWTCPAGVTKVMIQTVSFGFLYHQPIMVDVTPNTTYTYTFVGSMDPGDSNTLGSIFTWAGGEYLEIWYLD